MSTCPPSEVARRLDADPPQRGQTRVWSAVAWTVKHHFGPVMAIGTWQRRCEAPLYVLTNRHDPNAALLAYQWRFWIEPLFADFKGRGFRLGLTRLRDPQRLDRLLLVVVIAFLWTLGVGSHVFHSPRQRLVDRPTCSDHSLFQLSYRYLKHLLKLAHPLDPTLTLSECWLPRPLTLLTVR